MADDFKVLLSTWVLSFVVPRIWKCGWQGKGKAARNCRIKHDVDGVPDAMDGFSTILCWVIHGVQHS